MILLSNPFKEAVCIKSIAFPSANPSLMSKTTISEAKSLMAIYSAQLAPTAPAPTTVTFILFYLRLIFLIANLVNLQSIKE